MTDLTPIPNLAPVVGILLGGLVGVLLAGLVGLVVIAVVANRAEVDPTGRRPYGVYLFVAAFATLWAAVIASTALVATLVLLIGPHSAGGSSIHPFGDLLARDLALAGIALAVTGVLAYGYLRRSFALVREGGMHAAPLARVGQSYAGVVSLIALLVGVVALVAAGYALCQVIAPGVFAAPSRSLAARHLVVAGYLAAVAWAILAGHRRLFPALHRPALATPEA